MSESNTNKRTVQKAAKS